VKRDKGRGCCRLAVSVAQNKLHETDVITKTHQTAMPHTYKILC